MRRLLAAVAAVAAVILLAISVAGAEYEFGAGEEYELYPRSEMSDLMASLPDEVKGELREFAAAEDDASRAEALSEKLDIRYIFGLILSLAGELLVPAAGGCAALLGIVITVSVMKSTLSDGAAYELCELVTSLTVALSVGGMLSEGITAARDFISRISTVMNAMIPVMSGVMLSSGSITSASVSSSSLMLYITVTQNLTSVILVPLGGALFALSAAAVLLRGINISTLISSLRRLIMTVLSLSLMIFSFVLGIQTTLAKSADTLTMKTVRFALGSYIPIVGGTVSEALSTVSAGLSHVRSITGTAGVIILLLTVLPTVLSLMLSRLSLTLCRSIAETLGCDRAAGIIGDADSVLSIFLALCAMTAVFFIFAVVLFMNSGLGG